MTTLTINFPPLYREQPADTEPTTFDLIYCDPPWDYDGRTFLNSKGNDTGAASDHYTTMRPDELIAMGEGIRQISSPSSICFMWTTGPQLDVSIRVLEAWGFAYKTIAFVWEKCRTNPGYYTMGSTELVIVGVRGSIPKPRGSRKERQFLLKKRTRHSAKPREIRERIERMFPEQTKLELFTRRSHEGWWTWGNQSPDHIDIAALAPFLKEYSV